MTNIELPYFSFALDRFPLTAPPQGETERLNPGASPVNSTSPQGKTKGLALAQQIFVQAGNIFIQPSMFSQLHARDQYRAMSVLVLPWWVPIAWVPICFLLSVPTRTELSKTRHCLASSFRHPRAVVFWTSDTCACRVRSTLHLGIWQRMSLSVSAIPGSIICKFRALQGDPSVTTYN